MIESHFLTLSAHLFLSVSVFRLFTFPVIIDMLGLRSALLVVSSLSSQFLFLWFLFSSFVLLENLEPHFYLYAVFLSIYLFVQFLVVVVHITQHMSQLSQSTGVIFCQFKRTIETLPTLYAFYPPRLIIVLNVSFTCFKITSNSVIIFAPNVKHFLKIQKKKSDVSYIFCLLCSFFLPGVPRSFLSSSFLFRKRPSAIILDQVYCWQSLLVFLHLKMSHFSFICEGCFHWHRILDCQLFYFNAYKISCHLLWPPWFLIRYVLPFKLFFPYKVRYHFSLTAFKMSSVSLVPRHLIYVLAWISLSLSFGKLIRPLESVDLCLLPNWGAFSHYFCKYFFKFHPLFPLFLGLWWHEY